MKKALVLCASHNDIGVIKGLKKLGYYVVATGNVKNQPGEYLVDKWISADYSDRELILQIAENEKIDALMQCCNDYAVETAAYVAERLNLPGYDSLDTTLTLGDKDRFKKFTKEYGINSPISESFDDLTAASQFISQSQLPLIVKPIDSSGGNGVGVVRNMDDLNSILKSAFKVSRKGRIVVEPFLEGTQHGFCTFLRKEKVVAYCSNDEYSFVNPYRVEMDFFPASSTLGCYQFLIREIEKMAAILHLKDGIFHLQYIYSQGKPWIIEVMRRVPGNIYLLLSNRLNGIDWDYWEAKARCGLDCSDFPINPKMEGFYAYTTILAPRNGKIKSIVCPQEYEKYQFYQYMRHDVGFEVTDYKNQPIGYIYMQFDSREDMFRFLVEESHSDFVTME